MNILTVEFNGQISGLLSFFKFHEEVMDLPQEGAKKEEFEAVKPHEEYMIRGRLTSGELVVLVRYKTKRQMEITYNEMRASVNNELPLYSIPVK